MSCDFVNVQLHILTILYYSGYENEMKENQLYIFILNKFC